MTSWRANCPATHPPYQAECIIRTRSGEEFTAMLIHLNEQYHQRVKDKDVWKVKGRKSIKDADVVEWRFAIDI